MVVLWIILGIFSLLVLLILYLVFVPFTIYANTFEGRYSFSFPVILKLMIAKKNGSYEYIIRVFFIKFRLDSGKYTLKFENIFRKKKDYGEEMKEKKRKKKERKYDTLKRIRAIYRFIRSMFGSFHVKRFEATFDTGDYTLNALLVPVFSRVNGDITRIWVNFQDEYGFVTVIRSRLLNFVKHGLLLYIGVKRARIKQ